MIHSINKQKLSNIQTTTSKSLQNVNVQCRHLQSEI